MNTENLTKLAVYLEKLPDDYEKFEMSTFVDIHDVDTILSYMKNNGGICGTAGCAVGHGPSAGVKIDMSDFDPEGRTVSNWYEDFPYWKEYMKRGFDIKWGSPAAEWMFGGDWSNVDNTPQGAAARIRYLLDKGEAPKCLYMGVLEPFQASTMLCDDRGEEYFLELYQEYLK